MSLEHQVKMKMHGKRDEAEEREGLTWLYAVLGNPNPSPNLLNYELLRDGQLLCRVMNTLAPGSIPNINTGNSHFKLMENINKFTDACRKYGVPNQDLFQTADLFEMKDLVAVTGTIFALGRTVHLHPEWRGPMLGPKPAVGNTREWTDEQLRASEGIIGLQAGQNKGASQAGDNFGAGRIIF